MTKKTNKLLWAGAIGLGIYALAKNAAADPWNDVKNNYGMPVNDRARLELTEEVEAAKQEGKISEGQAAEILGNFNTVYDDSQSNKDRVSAGMAAINQAYSTGVQLPRTSRVLKENVTVKDKTTGEVRTGNIVELGTGSIKHISVKPVSSSSGGSSSSRSSSSSGRSSGSRVLRSNNAEISRDPDGRLRIKL